MATACATRQSHLDEMRKEIIEVFEKLISEVKARRDELLAQVDKIRREFESKNASILENIRELEEMRAYNKKMSVKLNLAMRKQQEYLTDIDSEIDELKIGLNSDSEWKLRYSTDPLIEQVRQFGEIINESCVITKYKSIYSKKLTAVKVITRYQDVKFGGDTEVFVDFDKGLLHILTGSYNNHLIAVFNANDYKFVVAFGKKEHNVKCIATSKEFIYVRFSKSSSRYSAIAQYKYSDYSLVKTVSDEVTSIFVNSDNQVIALTCPEDILKFRIYDRALNFKEEKSFNYQWEDDEDDIPDLIIVFSRGLFYIMYKKQILVFNQEGEHTHSMFDTEGYTKILKSPNSFFIDEVGNFIITDSATDSIKFFSPEGDLFHTIGEDTVGSDEVGRAYAVATYNFNVIVSCYGSVRVY